MIETVVVPTMGTSTDGAKLTISARPISVRLFARFAEETGFTTEYEGWDGDTWCSNDWIGRNHSRKSLVASPELESMAAIHLTEGDALEFCRWHGGVRLPLFGELVRLFVSSDDVELANRLGNAHELIVDDKQSKFGFCCFPFLSGELVSLNTLNSASLDYAAALRQTVAEVDPAGPRAASFRVVVEGC